MLFAWSVTDDLRAALYHEWRSELQITDTTIARFKPNI